MGQWCETALFDARSRYVALFCVMAALLWPFGFGPDVCALKLLSNLPCPGCGMTRAFVALASGEFAVAFGANPFVLVAFPTFLVLGGLALLPDGAAERLLSSVGPRLVRPYALLAVAFLGFGLLRVAYFAVSGSDFP